MDSLTKKIASFFDYDKESAVVSPYALWLGILASSALALFLILWFGVSLFLRIESGSFFAQANIVRRIPNVTIDKERLAATTARYEARRAVQDERKAARLWVNDPSF